jgi:dTDP-4-amino-4,6-dideoxygalactose transaminase
MIKFADLNFQIKNIRKDIFKSIKSTIKKSTFIGGENVVKFENKFKKIHNIKYCLGVANGTDALEIAIESLNLKKNSEVLLPVNTWISTAEAVVKNNLKLKFVDIDKNTFLISTEDIKKKITKNTSAIIPVHLYGQSCEMNEILTIANKNKLKIIEDCAQAHLAEYKSKKVGTFGHISCFSFFPGKNLGAMGDAGAILTNSIRLFKKCKMIANHGGLKKNSHIIVGRNSRLDNLQAGILNIKLTELNKWTSQRIKNAKFYENYLKKNNNILLPFRKKYNKHVYHLFVVLVNKRNKLINYLKKNKIQTNIHYPKILTQVPAFKKDHKKNFNNNAKNVSKKILSLPIGEHLKKNEIRKISKIINKFYSQRGE